MSVRGWRPSRPQMLGDKAQGKPDERSKGYRFRNDSLYQSDFPAVKCVHGARRLTAEMGEGGLISSIVRQNMDARWKVLIIVWAVKSFSLPS